MAISLRCSSCSFDFEVPDSFAGKLGKCPQCNTVLRAPGATGETTEPAAPRAQEGSKSLPKAKPLPLAAAARATDPALSGTIRPDDTVRPGHASSKPAPAPSRSSPSNSGFVAPVVTTAPTKLSSSGMHQAPIGAGAAAASLPPWFWAVVATAAVVLVGGAGFVAFSLGGKTKPSEVARPTTPVKPRTNSPAARPGTTPGGVGTVGSIEDNPLAKPRVGHTIEDVRLAMVKIHYPTGGGVSLGSGFIVDKRGWVATNHHVIDGANSGIRCTLSDGKEYAVAGLIADSPEKDLAIIKLSDRPFQLTVLDIGFYGEPKLGSEVFAYGHPHGVEFTLVKGIVGNVCSTQKLGPESQAFLYSSMHCSPDHIWIQHDANIHPGNSGGPLLDRETLRVIGVNTWVNAQVRLGYASHIQYLRDLLDTATDNPQAFPPPKPGQENGPLAGLGNSPLGEQLSVERLLKASGRCAEFQWQPESDDQYAQLAEFAVLLTMYKEVSVNATIAPDMPLDVRTALGEAADRAYAEVIKLTWNDDLQAAYSRHGGAFLDRAGGGLATVCTVEGTAPGALLVKLSEGGKLAVAQTSADLADTPKGTRMVIFAMTAPIIAQVNPSGGGAPVKARLIKVHYAIKLGT